MAESIFPVDLQQACGCPIEPWRFPYRCQDHAAPRVTMPDLRRDDYYRRNCCPFCGRCTAVDRHGRALACSYVDTNCKLCGIVSCERHDMAAYRLKVTCPTLVNPRTKHGRALLAALATWGAPLPKPERGRVRV